MRNLVILVRADPIICGHSTEARNLAEAAHAAGFDRIHIVSYPIETLKTSGLPLKPLESVQSYSQGITVDRPEPVGDYKVLDGRLGYAISGHLMDLLNEFEGPTMVMDLYIVPHGMMVMNAIEAFDYFGSDQRVATVAEAVGSDITNVVNAALKSNEIGAAQLVLSSFLRHELPVAVSDYTRDLIFEAGRKVDEIVGTRYEEALRERVKISYPAIDTSQYLRVEQHPKRVAEALSERGLEKDGYIMFLSRLARAKGVDDLVHAYRASDAYGEKKLVICGNGPESERLHALTDADPNIVILHDVGDEEKGLLMHGCAMYCLPSKARPEFTETFGIAIAEKMLAGGLGPVVTTRTGGIPEATGDQCIYHEAGNVKDLTRALDEAFGMTTEQRHQLSADARQYAMQFDRAEVFRNLLRQLPVSAEKAVAVTA
ncbi:glycosyltransferase family 4 protein [Algisphaera agarilytica]|uniref:Glycosyltransferase involved in cell wall biosynthesis n=1 Tax=Algisphaera agarilytica TaxID=1385975 RepID=A0A7X0H4Y9_9BACT|nr:glycosyltransferase family 4 protein [Algisphaera agarilytica]MBB6429372.1 glycosyltransferase involved in cell wall biosynthesis [Algisphaera agarilytica]